MRAWLSMIVVWVTVPSVAWGEPDLEPRFSVGARAVVGASSIGELGGTAYGAGVFAHFPFDPVEFAIEHEIVASSYEIADSGVSERGNSSRVRLLAQLPLLELQHKRFRGGMSGSVGLGYEWAKFDARESVRRDFVSWGLDSKNGFATAGGSHWIGIDIGFRIDVARAPNPGKRGRPPSCTAVCDTATVVEPIDVTLLMGLTVSWGPL